MEKICPIDFFCFDKNTFILFILFVIVVVVYSINNNTYKFELEKRDYNNKIDTIKTKLEKTHTTVNK